MELTAYLQYIAALIFVIALILAIAWGMRRFGLTGAMGAVGGRRGPRLSLTEALSIDGRHRLVLVRRDGVEHLLLLGATQDLLVESGIPVTTVDSGTPAAPAPPAPGRPLPPPQTHPAGQRPGSRAAPRPQPQPQPQPQSAAPVDDAPAADPPARPGRSWRSWP